VRFSEPDVTSDLESTVYEASVGLQGMIATGWAFWGSLSGQWDARDYRRIEGQLGIRGSW
jgi:outer membrane autotransporter protein